MPAPSRLTSILPRENPGAICARDKCRSETLVWLAADHTVELGEVCEIPRGGGTGRIFPVVDLSARRNYASLLSLAREVGEDSKSSRSAV
jgi:hypothetical protein